VQVVAVDDVDLGVDTSRRAIVSSNSMPASIDRRSGQERATRSRRSTCASSRSPSTSIAISKRRGVEWLS
jgi:hypothetical protein